MGDIRSVGSIRSWSSSEFEKPKFSGKKIGSLHVVDHLEAGGRKKGLEKSRMAGKIPEGGEKLAGELKDFLDRKRQNRESTN